MLFFFTVPPILQLCVNNWFNHLAENVGGNTLSIKVTDEITVDFLVLSRSHWRSKNLLSNRLVVSQKNLLDYGFIFPASLSAICQVFNYLIGFNVILRIRKAFIGFLHSFLLFLYLLFTPYISLSLSLFFFNLLLSPPLWRLPPFMPFYLPNDCCQNDYSL